MLSGIFWAIPIFKELYSVDNHICSFSRNSIYLILRHFPTKYISFTLFGKTLLFMTILESRASSLISVVCVWLRVRMKQVVATKPGAGGQREETAEFPGASLGWAAVPDLSARITVSREETSQDLLSCVKFFCWRRFCGYNGSHYFVHKIFLRHNFLIFITLCCIS